jgi:hypothetical protein
MSVWDSVEKLNCHMTSTVIVIVNLKTAIEISNTLQILHIVIGRAFHNPRFTSMETIVNSRR